MFGSSHIRQNTKICQEVMIERQIFSDFSTYHSDAQRAVCGYDGECETEFIASGTKSRMLRMSALEMRTECRRRYLRWAWQRPSFLPWFDIVNLFVTAVHTSFPTSWGSRTNNSSARQQSSRTSPSRCRWAAASRRRAAYSCRRGRRVWRDHEEELDI